MRCSSEELGQQAPLVVNVYKRTDRDLALGAIGFELCPRVRAVDLS
jgi:hypothetical protein